MTKQKNPGALAGATGAGLPCYAIAAGTLTLALCPYTGNAFTRNCASLAALDPASLIAFWLSGARIWGALT